MLETKQWSLTRVASIALRMTNSWRGPMIECVWLSLATPCPVRFAKVERLQAEG